MIRARAKTSAISAHSPAIAMRRHPGSDSSLITTASPQTTTIPVATVRMPQPPALGLEDGKRTLNLVLRAGADTTAASQRDPAACVQAEPERNDQQAARERHGSGAGDHKRQQPGCCAARRRARGAAKPSVLLAARVVHSTHSARAHRRSGIRRCSHYDRTLTDPRSTRQSDTATECADGRHSEPGLRTSGLPRAPATFPSREDGARQSTRVCRPHGADDRQHGIPAPERFRQQVLPPPSSPRSPIDHGQKDVGPM